MMLDAEDYFVADKAEHHRRRLDKKWRGRIVTMTVGPYKGYDAVIDGVALDANKGVWTFLCMVLSKRGDRMLNSDTQTRTFHPVYHFDVGPDHWERALEHSPVGKRNTSLHDIWFGGE